ncbi:MAG: FAD-binding protein, partial [Clostridia bacterium]|nr:FAD-binding protein [Clostridia bacterium]
GRVFGALTYNKEKGEFQLIESKLTVICTGGFCNIYPFSTNKSDIGGDGVAMTYYAGASLTDLEFVQFEPSAAVAPKKLRGQSVITTMYYEGAVCKNTLGERFMLKYSDRGECVDKDVQSKHIYREIQEGRATENGGVYFDATGVGREKLNEMYSSYVKRYQNVGIDIATTPFEIAPAPHTSLGGVVVDGDCRTEIKGLFACGEIIGGLHGANRAGGNAGLETLVFGTIAGKSAAEFYANDNHQDYVPSKLHCDNFVNSVIGRVTETALDTGAITEMRGELESILDRKLSVLRCGSDLESAREELSAMLDRIASFDTDMANAEDAYALIRLENDVTTAYLLSLSCLERDMSIGCHVRSDCPEADGNEEKYRVNIRYGTGGAAIKKVPLK